MAVPRALTISRLLSAEVLRRMYTTALEILGRTGLRVDHPEVRDAIAGHKGFALSGDRIRISPEQVEIWHDRYRQDQARQRAAASHTSPEEFIYRTSDRNSRMPDRDFTGLRMMTREDVIAGTKLLHMLAARGVKGSTPGVPADVPRPLQPLEQFMIGAEYSGAGGATSWVTDIPTAEIIRDMNKVYGRSWGQSVWCPSPLVLGGPELNILWHFRHEVVAAAVGSMPAMGVSGPCDPISVFTLSVAETMGGATILHALLPDIPMGIGPHPEPADMRSGQMVFGTPEWDVLDLMHRELYEYLGGSHDMKLLHTSASLPNLQAQIERSRGALLGVLGGYLGFEPLGQIGLDEIWSPEQLLLDLEMIGEASRVASGAFSGVGLELDHLADVVDDVITSGSIFLEHQTTVSNFRHQYRQPAILQRLIPSQWEAAGKPDVLSEAQRQAEELISGYDYDPPQDILRELRVIYERGKERLGSA